MSKSVTRHTVNEQQYAAPAFQKSGFNLGYKRYSSFMLGRMHVSGYQNCMPGDKISGKNDGNFTFKRLVTPMVSDVDVAQYNFFIPFRALDRTFERAFAPSKNNGMSAEWSVPTVNTRYLVEQIFNYYYKDNGMLQDLLTNDLLFDLYATEDTWKTLTLAEWLTNHNSDYSLYQSSQPLALVDMAVNSLTSGAFKSMASKLYLEDALLDIAANIRAKLGDSDNPIDTSMLYTDFLYLYLDCLLTPWIGRYSYYGEFNYKYVRPFDLYRISHRLIGTSPLLLSMFDSTPQSEYPLRAMYVIWYERFRNINLEPVSSDLPYWRDFGSTSIFDLANGGNLCYLIYRIRPWYEDEFTTAQIDDLSRHVYAPIIDQSNESVSVTSEYYNNMDANYPNTAPSPGNPGSQKPFVYNLGWQDQVTGESKSISCPVPASINDYLSSIDQNFVSVFGLDLNTLRQSQQLERYLKRNYLFGDEYQDRMLAHYNSRVSDMRINRPDLLSMSLNSIEQNQEVSNVSTDETKVGDRTATATITASGDQYTTFCEEFGILINLLSFMPHSIYDGIQPQLLAQKVVDFPLPEFAINNEEFGRKMEIADSALDPTLIGSDDSDNRFMFGRYPAYHAWRQRTDQVGGDFLDELQDCTFRRFWGMYSDDTTPKLNYFFLHCRPNLGMFANTVMYDAQLYGDVVHECFVERVLPTPVETI